MKHKNIILFFGALLVFFVSFLSNNKYSLGDPQLTLLTSQQILSNGTINLYNYSTSLETNQFTDGIWKYTINDSLKQTYYSYPIGTSLVCIPFVWIANKLGMNMVVYDHDMLLQSILASLTLVLIFYLLYRLAALFLTDEKSMFIAALIIFSSSLISSCGIALWSFNFEIIFILIGLIHYLKNKENSNFYLLGFLFFMAWLCRPSAILFITLFSVYISIHHTYKTFKIIIPIIILFIPFIIFSQSCFKTTIPFYYNPLHWNKMPTDSTLWVKFIASSFGISRGFWIYHPFVILIFVGFLFQRVRTNKLYLMSIIWFVLHSIMVANQANWWGGWSYGPRLFTDAIIPIFIGLVLILSEYTSIPKLMSTISLFLFCVGIYIHSYAGLYNIHTVSWNDFPNIDKYNKYYIETNNIPQFLASEKNNHLKKMNYLFSYDIKKYEILLPEKAFLLYGEKNQENIYLTQKYNADKNRINLITTPFEIEKNTPEEFYFTPNRYVDAMSLKDYTIIEDTAISSIRKYVNHHYQNHIFICIQNKNLNPQLNIELENISIHRNENQFIFHLFENKLISDSAITTKYNYSFGPNSLDAYNHVEINAENNSANIGYNNFPFSLYKNGLNVLVVDKNGNVLDLCSFEPENNYRRFPIAFRVLRKK